MKKIFAFMLVFTLLATLFSFGMVEAKSNTVTLTGEIIKVSFEKSGKGSGALALKCEDKTYNLSGLTAGMEKYLNYIAKVTGTISKNPQGTLVLKVTDYKIISKSKPVPVVPPRITVKPSPIKSLTPIQTAVVTQKPNPEPIVTQLPKTVQLEGTLYNKNSDMYKFYLQTESTTYELIGNTKGMEKVCGSVILVEGNYVQTLLPTEFPLFSVTSYKIIRDEPQPTPIVTQLPKTVQLKGTLFTKVSDVSRFFLQTASTIYELVGNTEGMDKVSGSVLLVEGNYVYTLVATEYPLFGVTSYKVISDGPLPTPSTTKNITMADNGGYVYVLTGDEVKLELESNPTTGYDWSYITKPDQDVLLETSYEYIPDDDSGKLVGSGGKGVWTYKALKSDTVVIEMGYSRPWESTSPAKTFVVKVIVQDVPQPTPAPEDYQTIKGSLSVTKDTDEIYGTVYNLLLKSQSGPATLSGNTKGLENYDGYEIEVTGTYSLLKIYPPIFIVESYKIISEPTLVSNTHTIISDKALYFSIPDVPFVEATGSTTISWTEGTQSAFYSSKLSVGKDVYEFILVSAKTSNSNSITGLFNILMNGEVIVKEIPGELYGLSEPVGGYFKFYSEDMKWHMSSYVTGRIDF